MRRTRTSVLAAASILAVLSLATVASAQPGGPGGFGPPGGFGGFGGGPGGFGGRGGFGGGATGSHLLTLAEDSAVWDEIKITDTQLGMVTRLRASVNKQARQVRNEVRTQIQQAQGMDPAATGQPVDPQAARAARDAARTAEREAMAQNATVLQQQTDTALKKILKAEQFKRLQQIDYQEVGELVVARPDVSRLLGFSQQQNDKIQLIINNLTQGSEQINTARREMFASMGGGRGGRGGGGGGGGGNNNNNNAQAQLSPEEQQARRAQIQTAMEEMRTKSTSLKDQAIAQIGKVMTKAQKAKYETLIGKPFDVALLNNGQGPNNPFNPGGLNRGGGPGGGPGGPGGAPAAGTASAANGAAQTKAAPASATTGTAKGAATTKRRPGA